jgi:uncharacterized membrane protein
MHEATELERPASDVVTGRPRRGDSQRSLSDLAGWEAFLHAVFAIAITLLVLDIRVPAVEANPNADALLHSLADGWPRYFAYVLGFMYIGTYWIATHRTMRLLRGVDHWSMILGLLYLMDISTVPFVTALLAEYIGRDNGRDQVALLVFTGWQLLLSILANVLLRYAAHNGRLLRPDIDQRALRGWVRLSLAGPITWIVAMVAAVAVSGTITLVLMAVILLVFLQEVPTGSDPTPPADD